MKNQLLLLLMLVIALTSLQAQVPHILTENDVLFEDGEIKDYTSSFTDIIIPPFLYCEKVTSIGSSAFQFSQLTRVTIPNNVTSIGTRALLQTN
jgi:hypothetical protein